MKRSVVPLALLLVVVSGGCSPATAEPSPTPMAISTPAGPASCYLAPLQFAELSVPLITDADHTHGPAAADIVVIDYADFQ